MTCEHLLSSLTILNIQIVHRRKNERESKAISNEQDRQIRLCRDIESALHRLQLEESEKANEVREKNRLEEDVERMKQEIETYVTQAKVWRNAGEGISTKTLLGRKSTAKYPRLKRRSSHCKSNINDSNEILIQS